MTCTGKFEIFGANCTSIAPASINSDGKTDTTTNITITGSGLSGLTEADISFEGCGITVNSATANSDTEITANITVGIVACKQPSCTATLVLAGITTGCIITVNGPATCCKLYNTLLPLKAGILPRLRRIVINGEGSTWDRTSAVSIQDINIVIPLLKQSNRITAIIVIPYLESLNQVRRQ